MSEENPASGAPVAAEGSVVDQILSAFLTKVDEEAGMTDLGVRLRKALFETRDDTETELKAAIFGGDAG
jgi:hypothetical protein